jgi:hypothetical protein
MCRKDRETPGMVTKYWQPPINNVLLHSQHQQSEARFLEEGVATESSPRLSVSNITIHNTVNSFYC